jgi:UDP-N-acetylglucosamine acyltransferase
MNKIHPTVIIDYNYVQLGENNSIGPYSVIHNNTIIGNNNKIGSFVSIGSPPGKESVSSGGVYIGSNNTIREHSTINAAESTDPTSIGNDCFIMSNTFVGHDCKIGNSSTLSPFTSIGGHTIVENNVTMGMHSVAHQRLNISKFIMSGMGAIITKSFAPYSMLMGIPAKKTGLNLVGIERAGISLLNVKAEIEIWNSIWS